MLPDTEYVIPRVAIRRFVGPANIHIHTTSDLEYNQLIDLHSVYRYEMVSGYLSLLPDGIAELPLFRIYQRKVKGYAYVMEAEKDMLVKDWGWVNEGIMGYCSDKPNPGMSPLYRFYAAGIYDHLIVNLEGEKIGLNTGKYGYAQEGNVTCFAYTSE